jgi:hypothetical protein
MPFPDYFSQLDPQHIQEHQAARNTSPEDLLEPEPDDDNLYREASVKFMSKVLGILQFLKDSKTTDELLMRLDVLSAIFSLDPTSGDAFTDIASKHNRTRAAVSAQAQSFLRANNMPPTLGQKSKIASASYSKKRLEKLKQ